MSKWFDIKEKKRRSLKATDRAIRGWKIRHARRDVLAAKDPIQVGGKIKRRIVVIDDELHVKERAFYEFDRECDWERKLREVLA